MIIKLLTRVVYCFLLLSPAVAAGQDPVDCINAIIVCDNQQLNYNSNGPGLNDFGPGPNNNANGCLTSDEHQSAWFQIYISPSSPPGATLAFTLSPTGGQGQDYDFALYGPNVTCDDLGNPIRCSFAASSCFFCPETGLGMGTTDFSEGATGDGFVAEVTTQPGESYLLLIDNWSSSNQGFFLDWTGTALLSCSCSTTPVISGNNEICPGETAVLTATGNNLSTFSWSTSGGGTISGPTNGSSINATSAGTYTVSVTDEEGCLGSASYVVTISNGPDIDYSVDPSTCGLSNGSIDVTISGSPGPYMYDWSTNATTQDLVNISAGTYSLTVEDANGCTATATIVVTDENQPLIVSGVVSNNSSCTIPNGSITATVNPPGTYTYTWSNGGSTSTITNLAPGTYTLTVTSSGSCTGTATFTVVNAANAPVITSTPTSSICDLPNGSINVTVSGGVAPYAYSWSGGQTTEDLSAISQGTYSLTVTGANGCTASASIVVSNTNPTIAVSGIVSANTSCSEPNGSISLTITPPNSPTGLPYTFLWSGGETVQNISNLVAGNYTVEVSAGGSCITSASFTILDEPDVPEFNANITAEECGAGDGMILLTMTGGQSPFTYLWSNGSTGPALNNIPAGSYSVTVTGSNACTAVATYSVTNNQITFTATPTIQPNTSCSSNYNGSISISISPAGNYEYAWSTGESSQNIMNIAPGNYTVTVTAGMCEQEFDFVVPNTPLLPAFSITASPAICGEANGIATLVMTGGEGPFTFLWSNGAFTQNILDLLPENYSVTVTGANECEAIGNVTIANTQINITATPTITPNTSCIDGNGAISLNVTPATGLTFDWSNGASTQQINNLTPGEYTVTISAGGNCQNTFTYNVPDAPVTPVINLAAISATCGQSNGSIDLTMSTGTAPFTFDWSSGENTQDLVNVQPELYSVTVTDALGCTGTATITVNDNIIPIAITGETTANTSCEFPNGTIDIDVSPSGSYQYIWSSGEDTQDLYNIDLGSYTVTVSLGTGCTSTSTFTVIDNSTPPVVESNATPAICGEANGAINLTISSSTPPYSFEWSTGENSEDIADLLPGTYSVTVSGANACTTVVEIHVANNSSSFSISGTAFPVSSCLQPNGMIDLTIDPPGVYDILWSTGVTAEDLTNLTAGNYYVTVSLAGNCSATATFSIADQTSLPAYNTQLQFDECDQSTGSIEVVNLVGDGPFTFLWSNGETTSTIDSLGAGNYSVTVSDINGCVTTTMHVISSTNIDIGIVTASTPNTVCASPNGSIDITVSPAGTHMFNWSNGQMTEDLAGLSSGNYTVTVSTGSCSATATVLVGADASAVSLNSAVSNVSCFGAADGYIHLEAGGGTAPFNYTWDPAVPGSIDDLNNLSPGLYTVTVTDQAGCSVTSSFNLTEPPTIDVICNQSQNVSVPGGSDGIASIQLSGGTPPYSVSWTPGSSATGLQPGIFDIHNLSEGSYSVGITDANGCTAACTLSITAEDCITATGTLDPSGIVVCGAGCFDALYDATGELLNDNDIIQFILHEGPGQQIQNEIARAGEPSFCFDSSRMMYNVQYYIAVVAGNNDGSGNVLLTSPCAKIGPATPVIFHAIPVASIDDSEMINCDNPTVELTGHSSISASSFEWTTKTGSITSDPNLSTIVVNQAGFYELVVTALTCRDTAGMQVDASNDFPSLDIGPVDDLNCSNSEVTLVGNVQPSDVLLQWAVISNGDTTIIGSGSSITVDAPGEYHLLGTAANGCVSSASVSVNQFTTVPFVDAGEDLTLNCDQSPITIQAYTTSPVSYTWISLSDISLPANDQPAIAVDQPGTYVIQVRDTISLCMAADTVEVLQSTESPVSIIDIQQISCHGESDGTLSVLLPSGAGPYTITLNGEDSGVNGVFSGLHEGVYTIEVTDTGGCLWSTEVALVEPEPLAIDLGLDLSVQPGQPVTINAVTNILPGAIASITWTPDQLITCLDEPCTSIMATMLSTTQLAVTLMDTSGCIAQDQVTIRVADDRKIFIPTVFSPNGDGVNDIFYIAANDNQIKSITRFVIYDRWGNEVYEAAHLTPNDPSMGWDGKFRNLLVNPGVFVYLAEIEFMNGEAEVFAGDVTVVR
jgi:gliding motility-associated-like protein